MYPVFESIKIVNGRLQLLDYHLHRMTRTAKAIWGTKEDYKNVEQRMEPLPTEGVWKCKLAYDHQDFDVQITPYHIEPLHELLCIEQPELQYPFKFTNREALEKFKHYRTEGTDILFTRQGELTDAYYANVILWNGHEWHTPVNPLLKGVKRGYLIDQGMIKPKKISVKDLSKYQKISLISAMLDPLERSVEIENCRVS